MTFAYPHFLWLLFVVPPGMVLFFWWSARTRRKLMTQFIQARLLPGLVMGISTAREKIRAALLIAAAVFLIVALARPQWGYSLEEVKQRGLDIVVAIDTSKSMLAEDIAPNRLTRARYAALDLMQQAKSDRLGLVAFAGTAFLQCPLTIDDSAFRQSLQSLDVNTLPEGGTALAEAIYTAQRAFKEGEGHKVLVLFTDGEDHDSGAVQAAKLAAKAGLRVFTIGIGSANGDLIRIKGPDGQSDFVRDENGNVVKSHLNEDLLRQIASSGHGFYLPLVGANAIDTLYRNGLAPLPKAESQEKWVKHSKERYHWPLAIAIVLLIAEVFFPERKEPSKVRPLSSGSGATGSPRPKVEMAAVAAFIAVLITPSAGKASPASALKDFKSGKYAEAQKEYERLASEDKKGDMRFIFNAGDAAYRATNYDAAIKCFTTALVSRDANLQAAAYFNIGNALYRKGEEAKDLDGVEEQWKQAEKNFQNALAINKNDADAAHNLAFVRNGLKAITQMREAARQAKEAADGAIRRRNYHRAVEILDQQVKNNVAAKQFEDFVKKLKEIDEIANPDQR
ncbi:MAG TPA: VWA domain-containing protein [Candidatus Paceibacterota bacterium]|nr:VWA domain-containing protein [Candidatus Paceibacterota bacterium]